MPDITVHGKDYTLTVSEPDFESAINAAREAYAYSKECYKRIREDSIP